MTNTILILGSNSDIGKQLIVQYLNNGDNIYCAARDEALLKSQVSELKKSYPKQKIEAVILDITTIEKHASLYHKLDPKPDGVISVMGYLGEQNVSEISLTESMSVIYSNYVGHVALLNEVANDFERRKQGFIVGISSVAAERGRQSNYIYGSAKAGFTAYLSGLRNRLFHSGVHVLTVHPGFVATKMTAHLDLPPALTASAQELADAIFKAVKKKKNIIYVKPIWRYIMLIIRHIPEKLFKRLSL